MNSRTIFEEKAIRDFALSLLDWGTDRASLPGQAIDLAQLLGCTVPDLIGLLHGYLCSLMGLPRTLDVFGAPMLDITLAKDTNRFELARAAAANQVRSSYEQSV